MKSNLFFIKLFTSFFITSLFGKNLTLEEKNFIENHYPPKDIIKKLDVLFNHLPKELELLLSGKYPQKSKKEVIQILKREGFTVHNLWFNKCIPNLKNRKRRATLTHKDIPNYFLKIGFDEKRSFLTLGRVVTADLVNEITKEYSLTALGIIEKKIYHRPHRPSDLNDFNYIVLSPRIKGHVSQKQDLDEFYKQFITSNDFMLLKSIFNKKLDSNNTPIIILDFHHNNFITNNNNVFFLIDTEPIFEIKNPPFSKNLNDFKSRLISLLSNPIQ